MTTKQTLGGLGLLAVILCALAAIGGGSYQDGVLLTDVNDRACGMTISAYNSLCYRVHEIERHFHGRERWFGKLAVQTATDWADTNLSPFRAISGNNAYGSDPGDEAQVIGTDDTPSIAGNVKYDLHRFEVVAASSTTPYRIRLVYGTGTMADAVAAGQYSEEILTHDPAVGAANAGSPIDIMMPRLDCGSGKVWVQVWNATNNATLDFFVGLHEYEG